jgi:hypothetical protein
MRFAVIGFTGAALWIGLFPGFLHGVVGLMMFEEADTFFGDLTEWADAATQTVEVVSAPV